MKNKGFTVVEVFVVIAIICILGALLIPAINAAREAAKEQKQMKAIPKVEDYLVFQVDRLTFTEFVYDGHEYLLNQNTGGMCHKENCEFCENLK